MMTWILLLGLSALLNPSVHASTHGIPSPDFISSMKHHRLDWIVLPPIDADNLKKWNTLEELYKKNKPENIAAKATPTIPKIIHQIWLGSPLPERYKHHQRSWIKMHPTWQYKLWTDRDIRKLGLYNQAAYDAAANYGERSDIARYEILYRFGGLYVDTDFECLIPFDIFHHRYTFYTGVMRIGQIELNNALIGSAPHHPLLRHCIESISNENRFDPITQTEARTGPTHFTKSFFEYISSMPNNDLVIALPISFFYPLPVRVAQYNTLQQIKEWITPNSYAVHYWANSWTHGHGLVNKRASI
ncbi:MAG TPA: glycosyltransferase [Candidatus Babeliaceae bacterium]|nr:glycosyltransferase [Candidatus Babeliaceae bacterium]